MPYSDQSSPDRARLSAAVRLVLRHYWSQIKARPVVSALGLLLPGIGEVFVWYLPPLILGKLFQRLSSEPSALNFSDLTPYVVGIASVWLLGEIMWRVAASFTARAEIRSMQNLYVQALDELLAKDLSFFHDNFAGSLTKRALNFSRRFENFFDSLSFSVIAHLLPIGFAGFVLWSYSPWLIVALLAMMTLTMTIIFPLIRRRQKLVEAREVSANVLAGHLSDSITNMEAIRAFAREHHEAEIHVDNVHDYGSKALRSWEYQNLRIDTITSPMYVATNILGLLIAVAVSSKTTSGIESIFVTFSYFATSTRVMWEFNRIYRNMESLLTEAAQFTELLLDPPAVVDAPDAEPFAPKDFAVDLMSVSFRHKGRAEPLFDDFTLSIADGEKIGLVGRSGGGKSTLTRLLLRFSDLDSGQILIGGQDIAKVPQKQLRQHIAYVPQDPAMFHRSLADNIRVGRPDASDEEVLKAAELAHAAEFIAALPLGYATLVGERGVKLSGGQRQRIAIARAILKQAPILILDEATSSLDSESEGFIQDALISLMHDRTAIVIAHRLSTVRRMDRLIVLDEGRIVEQGSHDELVAFGGIYASLWMHQSGGFLAGDLEPVN
jgi:ATP-binding cassette, subfamily B, bacterial